MTKKQLAILYGIIFTVNSLSLTCIAAFEHVTFAELTKEDWLVIVLSIVGSWTTTMLAFVSNAMHNVQPDAPVIPIYKPGIQPISQYATNTETGGLQKP